MYLCVCINFQRFVSVQFCNMGSYFFIFWLRRGFFIFLLSKKEISFAYVVNMFLKIDLCNIGKKWIYFFFIRLDLLNFMFFVFLYYHISLSKFYVKHAFDYIYNIYLSIYIYIKFFFIDFVGYYFLSFFFWSLIFLNFRKDDLFVYVNIFEWHIY